MIVLDIVGPSGGGVAGLLFRGTRLYLVNFSGPAEASL